MLMKRCGNPLPNRPINTHIFPYIKKVKINVLS